MARDRRRKRGDRQAERGGIEPRERVVTQKGEQGGGSERGGLGALWEWAKSLATALVLFFFIRTFLIHTFVIISGSMEDTLLVGDLLLVNRAAIGSRLPGTSFRIPGYSHPKRGDILVFDPPHERNMKLVKRLVGLPGDTLEMRNKVLYLNGKPLNEPYVRHDDRFGDDTHPWMAWQERYRVPDGGNGAYRPTRDNWGPIVVPADRYFMLGDNRDTSLDSRYWGFLEGWRLEGRAVLIYFSYQKDPPTPFAWVRKVRWSRIGDRVR